MMRRSRFPPPAAAGSSPADVSAGTSASSDAKTTSGETPGAAPPLLSASLTAPTGVTANVMPVYVMNNDQGSFTTLSSNSTVTAASALAHSDAQAIVAAIAGASSSVGCLASISSKGYVLQQGAGGGFIPATYTPAYSMLPYYGVTTCYPHFGLSFPGVAGFVTPVLGLVTVSYTATCQNVTPAHFEMSLRGFVGASWIPIAYKNFFSTAYSTTSGPSSVTCRAPSTTSGVFEPFTLTSSWLIWFGNGMHDIAVYVTNDAAGYVNVTECSINLLPLGGTAAKWPDGT